MTAVVAIINYGNKVLIGKKRIDSPKFLAGEWHIPGGGVREKESDEEALKREMKEETGLDISVKRYLGLSISPTSRTEVRWYECFAKTNNAAPGSDLERLEWVDKKDVLYICGSKATSLWTKEIIDYFD